MHCTSIKPGVECPFMTAKGCGYKGGLCHQVVEQCSGCGRQGQHGSGWYCTACPVRGVYVWPLCSRSASRMHTESTSTAVRMSATAGNDGAMRMLASAGSLFRGNVDPAGVS